MSDETIDVGYVHTPVTVAGPCRDDCPHPDHKHNHDPIGVYANCPGCGTVLPEDRWEETSFADSIEAAIHHTLIEFSLALDERRRDRTRSSHPDESDIFIRVRRQIRALADGSKDPDEYLDALG